MQQRESLNCDALGDITYVADNDVGTANDGGTVDVVQTRDSTFLIVPLRGSMGVCDESLHEVKDMRRVLAFLFSVSFAACADRASAPRSAKTRAVVDSAGAIGALMDVFDLNRSRIETRVVTFHEDWDGYLIRVAGPPNSRGGALLVWVGKDGVVVELRRTE